jgi:hypothetical protein
MLKVLEKEYAQDRCHGLNVMKNGHDKNNKLYFFYGVIFHEDVVLQSYTNSENMLEGPYGETYPACHDGEQTVNIKAEEEVDPVPITFPKVKAEPEVSCMSLYVHC